MKIRCSLIGIDDTVRFPDMLGLKKEFPFAEFGIAYSERTGDAGHGCYASLDFAQRAAEKFSGSDMLSLHLCYRDAIEGFLKGQGRVAEIAKHVPRVQLNFSHEENYRGYDLDLIKAAFANNPSTIIITTHNPQNADLWEKLKGIPNHEILYDASAGRGIVSRYQDPFPGIVTGYAGGLSPENLARELPLIYAAALRQPESKRILWTDKESGVRAGLPAFPMDRAAQCLHITRDFILSAALEPRPRGLGTLQP